MQEETAQKHLCPTHANESLTMNSSYSTVPLLSAAGGRWALMGVMRRVLAPMRSSCDTATGAICSLR